MTGRWPANVVLSPAMAQALDEQSGNRPGASSNSSPARVSGFTRGGSGVEKEDGYGDSGGASRFFLTAGYEPWELEWILESGLRPCG